MWMSGRLVKVLRPSASLVARLTAFLALLCIVSANATPLPVAAVPPRITEPDGDVVEAITATLIAYSNWNTQLSETLTAQGLTMANHWAYTTTPPAPWMNPMSLGNNATFNVTTYTLALGADGETVTEEMDFTLDGSTVSPTHWLQLIHESERFPGEANTPFGFQISGFSGYWQVDNGDLAPGDGPFYDSHGGNIVPNDFHDDTEQLSPVGSYLQFFTIPAWDVQQAGIDYVIVANAGVTWGWQDTCQSSQSKRVSSLAETCPIPEPPSIILVLTGAFAVIALRRRQRTSYDATGIHCICDSEAASVRYLVFRGLNNTPGRSGNGNFKESSTPR